MTRKHCLVTGKSHAKGFQRRNCKLCKMIYARNRRKTIHGQLETLIRNASIYGTAQELANRAIYIEVRAGRLPRVKTLKCVDCGSKASCYDHRDYLKQLEVEPVCRSCNYKRGPALNK